MNENIDLCKSNIFSSVEFSLRSNSNDEKEKFEIKEKELTEKINECNMLKAENEERKKSVLNYQQILVENNDLKKKNEELKKFDERRTKIIKEKFEKLTAENSRNKDFDSKIIPKFESDIILLENKISKLEEELSRSKINLKDLENENSLKILKMEEEFFISKNCNK